MINFIKKIFTKEDKEEKDKNQVTNKIRVRILRLDNDTPVESYEVITNIIKDENGNRIIKDDDLQLKEEISYSRHALVSDVLFKVKHRLDSKEKQIEKINEAIKKQEDLVNSIRDGKIEISKKKETENDPLLKEDIDLDEVNIKNNKIKVNVISEKVKLNVLKVSKYTLENEGAGSFSRVGSDGIRVLEYVLEDGDLKPIFFKSSKIENEPIKLYVDQAQKKKYYKEADNMIEDDYLAQTNSPFRGIAQIILIGLFVALFLGNIWWTLDNNARSNELDEQYSTSAVANILRDVESVNKQCAVIMGQIVEEQKPLVDYAKEQINKTQNNSEPIKI